TAYLVADESAAPGFRTRAGAWVNTAVNAGSSGGAAVMGLLVGRVPLPLCFALAGTQSLLAAAVTARGGRHRVPAADTEPGAGGVGARREAPASGG
ncbi:MFS transporter, partial [Streptomyces sp. NPDC002306]